MKLRIQKNPQFQFPFQLRYSQQFSKASEG